jgi:hypothetical protein
LIISRSVLLRMRNVSDKCCRGNQNTRFVFNNYFWKIVPFLDNVENIVELGRPQMAIWRMRIACWITKVYTHTHTHTHTHTNTHTDNHTNTHTNTNINTNTHAQKHTQTHTRTITQTHTDTQT